MYFLQLNEFNFDLISRYAEGTELKNFRRIIESGVQEQNLSEAGSDLEPWIQWVNIYTGKNSANHGVFRLGHGASVESTLFHDLQRAGVKQFLVCPMNAPDLNGYENIDFVPDPWSGNRCRGDIFSRLLDSVAKQSVNDNSSGKLTVSTYIRIFILMCWAFDAGKLISVARTVIRSRKNKWLKAMVFEQILALVSLKKTADISRNDFCSIFFNGIAHTQHHYLRSSKFLNLGSKLPEAVDPLEDCLLVMDEILGWFLDSGREVVFCTGLSQEVYQGDILYWRPLNHEEFLDSLGVPYSNIRPCMTRDFEIYFDEESDKESAIRILSLCEGEKTGAKVFDLDAGSAKSIFCTLCYPRELDENFVVGSAMLDPTKYLVFVAKKNGGHRPISYFGVCSHSDRSKIHDTLPMRIEDVREFVLKRLKVDVIHA